MASIAGAHNQRVADARELRTPKGRKAQQRFAFEGPTLLEEATRSGAQILELFVTRAVYDSNPLVREAETGGSSVFIVDDRTAQRLSDVDSPTGLVAVAPLAYAPLDRALAVRRCLILAELNDPGNAGTLMRSAEAFGAQAVIFGAGGVEPYHPKVIRAAMGAAFRLALAVATPQEASEAAAATGAELVGLDAQGEDIRSLRPADRLAIVVGHERRGLGPWAAFCTRRVAIPMPGQAESLNAAVAGSIALYALACAAT